MNTARLQPNDAPWWSSFFDDDYATYGLAHTPPELLAQTLGFLQNTLELQAGQAVFDQCCGIGRLSLPLAERGIHVCGVDQAETYAAAAQREADRRGLPCRYVRGDAFTFTSPQPCDAGFNWFTSFGYSEDDSTNVQMLHRAFESLKPKGRFLLDYMNVPKVLSEFRGKYFERSPAPGQEGLIILYDNELDFLKGMIASNWTLMRPPPDTRRDQRRVVTRMLLPSDLVRMFHIAGFEDVRLFGWVDGEPLALDSRRCIVFGRKPG